MVMSTFTKLTYHIVFSTKLRRRFISGKFHNAFYEYIGGIIRGLQGALIEIGGVEDHVHLLTNLSPTYSVSDAIRDIKTNSSKWANDHRNCITPFQWQKGYGAFTVSHSQVDTVREYIQNQQYHHRTKSFREEYIEFLERHQIAFNPRYLFEAEHHG
jgi:putative transposase